MTLAKQLEDAELKVAELKALWLANKDKTDRKSRKIARDAAERLEFATNKVAMLWAMTKNPQFSGK